MEMRKGEPRLTVRIQKPVTKELYEVAAGIWRIGKKVTVSNLTKTCEALGVKTTRESIEDMVRISDFLDAACPM